MTSFIQKSNDTIAIFLLALIGFVGFVGTLGIIPTITDDAMMFTSVANNPHPFVYFVSDWGMNTNMYRPLLSLSYWVVYQLAGPSAVLNQGLSVACHIFCAIMVFKILRLQVSLEFSFLFSLLYLFSMYTVTSASLATDRCSLFVGVFFLLLVYHAASRAQNGAYVVMLSVLAVMSKESGLVVLGLAFLLQLEWKPLRVRSWGTAVALVALLIGYFLLRWMVFGPRVVYYQDHETHSRLGYIIVNLLAPFLPVFGSEGEVMNIVKRLPPVLLTLALTALVLRRPLNRLQGWALAVIAMNAVVHVFGFRYRFAYLAQIAFCFLLGSSHIWAENPGVRRWGRAIAALLLFYNVYWSMGHVRREFLSRYIWLEKQQLENFKPELETGRISPVIADQIAERYRLSW